jgi:hypothetical protein
MTTGPHRRGRRDNGLEASAYAAAADVDPRVGEHLLDVLGLAGIAAYLQPAADLHPVTRTTMLPNRPTDRLFVDREHLAEARGYVDQLRSDEQSAEPPPAKPAKPATPATPARPPKPARAEPRRGAEPPEPDPTAGVGPGQGPGDGWVAGETGGTDPAGAAGDHPDPTRPPDPDAGSGPAATGSDRAEPAEDVDAAWARIVADFDAPLEAPVPPWPVAEDVPEGAEAAGTETVERPAAAGDLPQGWRTGSPRPLIESLDADDPLDEDEEGYQPPPPPPIPRPSRYTALALLAIGVGLVLFFWPGLLTAIGFGEEVTLGLGVLGILVGFGTLVWRLRSGDDEEDDPDDGAVV